MENTKESKKTVHVWSDAFEKTEYLRRLVSKDQGHRATKEIAVGTAIKKLVEELSVKHPDVVDPKNE